MSFHATVALNTRAIEATRCFLNSVDTAIDPLCHIEFLAIVPRTIQVAVNTLGLVDGVISSGVLGLAALIPLPESIRGQVRAWRNDSWSLTTQLVDKLARLVIALIPLAGTKILSLLDHSLSTNDRLQGEIDALRATGLSHDREIAEHLETIKTLRKDITDLREQLRSTEPLKKEKEDLSGRLEYFMKRVDDLHQTFQKHDESVQLNHAAELDLIRQSHQKELWDRQEQLKSLQEQLALLAPLAPENKTLTAQRQELQEKITALIADSEQLKAAHTTQVDSLKRRADDEQKAMLLQIEQSKTAADALQTEVSSLHGKLAAAEQAHAAAAAAAQRAAERILEVEDLLQEEKKKTASVLVELDGTRHVLETTTAQVNEHRTAEDRLRHEIDDLAEKNRVLTAENVRMHRLRSPVPH